MKRLYSKSIIKGNLEPIRQIAKATINRDHIHQCRVATKRLRAHLRVIRKLSDDHPDIREPLLNLQLLSEYLSPYRDQGVLADMVKNLAEDPGAAPASVLLADLKSILPSGRSIISGRDEMQRLVKSVDQSLEALPQTSFTVEMLKHYCKGRLHKVHTRGELALNQRKNLVELHQWRKQIKRLYYQSRLLPGDKAVWVEILDDLGSALGLIHDIHVLEIYIGQHLEELNSGWKDENIPLYTLIHRRQEKLLIKCENLLPGLES